MPPRILNPPNDGVTTTQFFNFVPANANGIFPATNVTRWKVTVTTEEDNGGQLMTETAWFSQPITTCPVNNLPADNDSYYGQIIYETPDGSTFTSMSNLFQSCP